MMHDSGLFAHKERRRLAAQAALDILDTPAEHEFDAIVDLARRLLDCPIALVSLVDDHRQWFKARHGIAAESTPREQAFCAHTILSDTDVMIVEDATQDSRFADNPLVTTGPNIRFYAGVSLRPLIDGSSGEAEAIGSLCVIDTRPRSLDDDDKAVLKKLAMLVESLIRARTSAAAAHSSARLTLENAALIDRKNRQLRQAERMAAIGSWRFEIATGVIEWSDEVFAIHGLPVGDRPPLDDALNFYPEADRARVAALLQRAVSHGVPYELESDLLTANGVTRRVRCMGEAEIIDGSAVAVIGVFQDITERHAYETGLRQVANTDSLTGLPNRRMFEKRLHDLLGTMGRSAEPFAVLLVDLDGFKPVNDTFGHDAGDDVLRQMADRLRGPNFSQAFVARLGGDEFVMIITRPRDCAELESVVQSVLRELRYLIERDGTRLTVTATVGAALWDEEQRPNGDVLRNADLALYAAKRAQRGTGRIFGSTVVLHPWGTRPAPWASSGRGR